jgi:hypothetical protein
MFGCASGPTHAGASDWLRVCPMLRSSPEALVEVRSSGSAGVKVQVVGLDAVSGPHALAISGSGFSCLRGVP